MAKRRRRNAGSVDFECPNCGREYHRTLWEEVEEGGCAGPVTSGGVVCKCGALLFCAADDCEGVNVFWVNKVDMMRDYILRNKVKMRPAIGLYYDLVRVPHGYVPAKKILLWKRFPLLIKQFRDYKFFKCPQCDRLNFFKIEFCPRCVKNGIATPERRLLRARRNYFRNLVKSLEILVLPVLALLGKAWYVHSEQLHHKDGYGNRRDSY